MKRDKKALFIWLGISLFFIEESLRLGLGRFNAPGPGFLPFWVALIVGILTVIELARRSPKKESNGDTKALIQQDGLGKILYLLIFLFAYPILLDKIGFFLCTLLFTGACLRIIGGIRWVIVIVLSILITVFAYLLFVTWLQIIFPEGRWVNSLLSIGRGIFYGTH